MTEQEALQEILDLIETIAYQETVHDLRGSIKKYAGLILRDVAAQLFEQYQESKQLAGEAIK